MTIYHRPIWVNGQRRLSPPSPTFFLQNPSTTWRCYAFSNSKNRRDLRDIPSTCATNLFETSVQISSLMKIFGMVTLLHSTACLSRKKCPICPRKNTHTQTHTHTLNQIVQRAVPFNVTRWRVLVCDLATSNKMMIQRKGTANGFTTYNNQFLLNAGTHRWSDGASTTKHSFVSQRLLDGRWPPASTIKDKNQGYSLSEPAGSVSLEQTVTHTNRPLWACFLPIWCIHRPMIPRLWIYTSIASVPRLWTFLLP